MPAAEIQAGRTYEGRTGRRRKVYATPECATFHRVIYYHVGASGNNRNCYEPAFRRWAVRVVPEGEIEGESNTAKGE